MAGDMIVKAKLGSVEFVLQQPSVEKKLLTAHVDSMSASYEALAGKVAVCSGNLKRVSILDNFHGTGESVILRVGVSEGGNTESSPPGGSGGTSAASGCALSFNLSLIDPESPIYRGVSTHVQAQLGLVHATWNHQTMMAAVDYLQSGLVAALVDSATMAAQGAMEDISKSISRTSLDITIEGALATVPISRGSPNGIEAALGEVAISTKFGDFVASKDAAKLCLAQLLGSGDSAPRAAAGAGAGAATPTRCMEVHAVEVASLKVYASDELAGNSWTRTSVLECGQLAVVSSRNLESSGEEDGMADVAVQVVLPRVAPRITPSVLRATTSVLVKNLGGADDEL